MRLHSLQVHSWTAYFFHFKLKKFYPFKRLQVLYILFNYGGLAFPDISFQNCNHLLRICTHDHRRVSNSALTTSIVGYYRMSSEHLWKELQKVLAFDCIESLIIQCLKILSGRGPDEYDSVHLEAALEWIGSCFQYSPIMYYNVFNIQQTTDILLENLKRFFSLGEEQLLCHHIECVKKMLNWKGFFEAKYRVDDTMRLLNDLMRKSGMQEFTKVEIVSTILNDHLDAADRGWIWWRWRRLYRICGIKKSRRGFETWSQFQTLVVKLNAI